MIVRNSWTVSVTACEAQSKYIKLDCNCELSWKNATKYFKAVMAIRHRAGLLGVVVKLPFLGISHGKTRQGVCLEASAKNGRPLLGMNYMAQDIFSSSSHRCSDFM